MEDNCIFCKIVHNKIPCYKVYEDNEFLAFLDITPKNQGHTLVIPKKHYRWVWDTKENYSSATNAIANALKKAFNTNLVVSAVIGEEVPHAHIHLVPRFENDGHGTLLDTNLNREFTKEQMQEFATKIANALN